MFIYKRCEFLPDRPNFVVIPDDARVELMRLPDDLCEKHGDDFEEIEELRGFALDGRRVVMTGESFDIEGSGTRDAMLIEFTTAPLYEEVLGEYRVADIAEQAEYAMDGFVLRKRDEWIFFSLYDPENMNEAAQWDEITNVEGFNFEPDEVSFGEPFRFFSDKTAVEKYFVAGKV